MGQIFRRIRKIAKSYIDDKDTFINNFEEFEDDELKRTIDELIQDKAYKESTSHSDNWSKEQQEVRTEADAYKILGILHNAGVEEIKVAYKRKIQQYHPDKVASLGEELRALAEKKTREINLAFEILKKGRGFN